MRFNSKSCGKALAGVAVVAGILALTSRSEAAPLTHDGFYLQFNGGLGYLSSSVDQSGTTEKLSGMTMPASLLLGGTVGPVVIGGGFFADHAFSPSYSVNGNESPLVNDVTMTLIGIGMFADIYPNPHKGLHFQPFVGWGGLERSINGNSGGIRPAWSWPSAAATTSSSATTGALAACCELPTRR